MSKRVTISLPESPPKFRATKQRLKVDVDGTTVFGPEELGLDVRTHVLKGLEEGSTVGVDHQFGDRAGNWSPVTSSPFLVEDKTAPDAPGGAGFVVEDEEEPAAVEEAPAEAEARKARTKP